MTMTMASMLGAFLFLVLGVVEYFVFVRVVYPTMSNRHEQQKVTLEQGTSPKLVAELVRLQSLVVLPIIGYFLGGPIVAALLGAK